MYSHPNLHRTLGQWKWGLKHLDSFHTFMCLRVAEDSLIERCECRLTIFPPCALALLYFQLQEEERKKEAVCVSELLGSIYWLHVTGVFRSFVDTLSFWFLLGSLPFKISLLILL